MKNQYKKIAILTIILSLLPTITLADEIITTSTTHDSGDLASQYFSVQFTPSTSGTISAVTYYTKKLGSPGMDLKVGVMADNGSDTPSCTYLANGTLPEASASSTETQYTTTLGNSVSVTGGTKYWITFAQMNLNSSNRYVISEGTASGNLTRYSDSGCSFTTLTGKYIWSLFTVVVPKLDQTITFGTITDKTYGDADFAVVATTTSNLPTTFTSQTTSVCTASSTVHIISAGTCTIRASQSGNGTYNAAPDVDRSFTAAQKFLSISADNKTKLYGDSDPALSYQIASGGGDLLSGSLLRTFGEGVGSYNIASGMLALNGNYILNFTPGTFLITIGSTTPSIALATSTNPDGTRKASFANQTMRSIMSGGINITTVIPAGANFTGPSGWDGTFTMPKATTTFVAPVASAGNIAHALSSVEVGFGNLLLTFDKGVRLVFAGVAGNGAGYDHGSAFTQVTSACSGDGQAVGDALSPGADCKINVGSDLVIWTKHFSTFTVYSETPTPVVAVESSPVQSSGGGGGNGSPFITGAAATSPALTVSIVPAVVSTAIQVPVTSQVVPVVKNNSISVPKIVTKVAPKATTQTALVQAAVTQSFGQKAAWFFLPWFTLQITKVGQMLKHLVR